MTAPLVTIAIPLYRSRPFVQNITDNIDRLTYPNLEILVSDRHLADDAIEQLERRYTDDIRMRFLRQPDRANWVEHYNGLIDVARGRYFCWMPHDDTYDSGYIERLAAALEAREDAVLAFGTMRAESAGTPVPVGPFAPPPIAPGDPASVKTALRLLLTWELFVVVRGLTRRDFIRARNLTLPSVPDTVQADVCWAFSLALAAPILFVPGAMCTKRYRPDSASASWQYGVGQAMEEWRALGRILWQSKHSRPAVAGAIALLAGQALIRTAWRLIRPITGKRNSRVPVTARANARLGLSWMLASRRSR
jgi:glycosyltransferase involved in cell wall biosynthesis